MFKCFTLRMLKMMKNIFLGLLTDFKSLKTCKHEQKKKWQKGIKLVLDVGNCHNSGVKYEATQETKTSELCNTIHPWSKPYMYIHAW